MSWREDLPRIQAENEAWRTKHRSVLRERDAEKQKIRDSGREVMSRLSEEDRAAIAAAYGVVI